MSAALDINSAFAPLTPEEREGAAGHPQAAAAACECITPIPSGMPEPKLVHPQHGPPSSTWEYRDEDGAMLGYVCRFDQPGERKQFSSYTLWREDGRPRWRWRHWPSPRPLYGLDRLAAHPDARVVVVEGELCADAAQAVFPDAVVVTSPGGAHAAGRADWTRLVGRTVLIWPDVDEAGAGYAQAVVGLLEGIGVADVRTVDARALAGRTHDGGTRQPIGFAPDRWTPTTLSREVS